MTWLSKAHLQSSLKSNLLGNPHVGAGCDRPHFSQASPQEAEFPIPKQTAILRIATKTPTCQELHHMCASASARFQAMLTVVSFSIKQRTRRASKGIKSWWPNLRRRLVGYANLACDPKHTLACRAIVFVVQLTTSPADFVMKGLPHFPAISYPT